MVRGVGRPRKTFDNTGSISEKQPAGSKYPITFFRLLNNNRPCVIPCDIF